MTAKIKKFINLTIVASLLACILFFFDSSLPFDCCFNWKIYDALTKAKYKFNPPPAAIKDILLVTIDNNTFMNMAFRWPYPRAVFAKVIENLKKSGAKIIGFDFLFLGDSTVEDDAALKTAIDKESVVLATAIDENGFIDLFTNTELSNGTSSGFVTKLQDSDGITRKNLTYLVHFQKQNMGFLSWEMQLLNAVKAINLASLKIKDSSVFFKDSTGQSWDIPVEKNTKSFLINFTAYTRDFKSISFYKAYNGDFQPSIAKNKIVLLGIVSSAFGDIHLTPLGWIPGITLNANAFLTLYSHNFFKYIPRYINFIVMLIGVVIACLLTIFLKYKTALLLTLAETCLFLVLSCFLLCRGYIWNYSLFGLAVFLCPYLGSKIVRVIRSRW